MLDKVTVAQKVAHLAVIQDDPTSRLSIFFRLKTLKWEVRKNKKKKNNNSVIPRSLADGRKQKCE